MEDLERDEKMKSVKAEDRYYIFTIGRDWRKEEILGGVNWKKPRLKLVCSATGIRRCIYTDYHPHVGFYKIISSIVKGKGHFVFELYICRLLIIAEHESV